MSRPGRMEQPRVEAKVEPEAKKPATKSSSVLAGGFRAAALCRTTNGWASVIVEIDGDGKCVGLEMSPSQGFPDFVAKNLVKLQMGINQETLKKYSWNPNG